MSKITFRADDALVEQLDALDASKSEVMREALREFLDRHPDVGGEREVSGDAADSSQSTADDGRAATAPELTVNINLDGEASLDGADGANVDLATEAADDEEACKQCGAAVSADHSFCPNCGEERQRRAHCECGEEIRSDWTFCPGCGRRSPTSELFDRA
ncbi:double zinc ribbon domain-containing protein [Halolamina sediminis]|uniref:double zinc ribbon domain-containing protein n=1 Tax=Halolamina sediminis TaxID=1480675 RepID=UPI0006B5C8E6|nr:zinc ribbon domain-containing protein [Halolamina sediminis]